MNILPKLIQFFIRLQSYSTDDWLGNMLKLSQSRQVKKKNGHRRKSARPAQN